MAIADKGGPWTDCGLVGFVLSCSRAASFSGPVSGKSHSTQLHLVDRKYHGHRYIFRKKKISSCEFMSSNPHFDISLTF